MDPQKYYKILEIDRSASLDEARLAYRDLIAVWHPDRYTHNPRLQKKALEKMKTVNAAFEVVSRYITENGSGAPPGKTAPDFKPKVNQRGVDTVKNSTPEAPRTETWAKTEARLAALALAKEIADARKAAQDQEAARLAAAAAEKEAAAKRAKIEIERQARVRKKKAAEQAILEKEQARERVWEETEKKLRALKQAKENSASGPGAGGGKEKLESLQWYLKQITICCGVLSAALSANAVQAVIHFNFTTLLLVIGGGFFAWWIIARGSGSGDKKQ